SSKAFTPKIKLEHLITFSDAVFAFALTLMALTIDIPDLELSLTEQQLTEKLYEMIPQLESYILSFFIIALFWISYHQVFNHIRKSYISIVYLNLIFLLLITILSISTSLVISFDEYQISYLIYYTIVIITSGIVLLIWWYALQIKVISENTHPLYKKGMLVQLGMIPIIFSLALLSSFISLDIAQYFWLIIIPVYILIRQKYKH
ncbi:MAG TPA: TMEM175 family protein, partial [Candidatus Nitrosocosmicus sp.]|nr:TMEM175 family protein [Candidatus Nitrosocosmicus sp.]